MSTLHLFDAYGVELEYMLVDRETLDVRPVADRVLSELSGTENPSDCELGPITWSNELALHVIELKSTVPEKRLNRLPAAFETAVHNLQPILERLNLRLLPTAMHPWMQPVEETRLWPHEYSDVYAAYDRIFNCRSHGWANVQSVHLNLPFQGDAEFARLHAAVRLLLPLLPALAASSPVVEGRLTGQADSRMEYYAGHCRAVPTLTGNLIPEAVYDEVSYRKEILQPIYEDFARYDATGQMQHEFLNARGAIARFDRGSIEIRVIDVQEYPGADIAICAAAVAVLKSLVAETWSPLHEQQQVSTRQLRHTLDSISRHAEKAVLDDSQWLRQFGVTDGRCTAGGLWLRLLEGCRGEHAELDKLFAPLQIILQQGTLATRIRKALGNDFGKEDLVDVYGQVADCFDQWEPFGA